MKKNHGFTILELMIVTAIIGVISAMSVPILLDYMLRGKVAESMTLLAGTKGMLTEYYQSNNTWPPLSAIGAKTSGHYVKRMYTGGTLPLFYVEVIMKDDLGEAAGKSVRFTYQPEGYVWRCTTDGVSNPIPSNVLPVPCRD